MTKLPDHPQSQAEYQHLQQTCDVISLETRKLEAETGVGAEEKRVVSVPQDGNPLPGPLGGDDHPGV